MVKYVITSMTVRKLLDTLLYVMQEVRPGSTYMATIYSAGAEKEGEDMLQCGSTSASAGQTSLLRSLYLHVPVTCYASHCISHLK